MIMDTVISSAMLHQLLFNQILLRNYLKLIVINLINLLALQDMKYNATALFK